MTGHYDYNNYTTDWVMGGDGKRGNSFILIYCSLVQSTVYRATHLDISMYSSSC